MVEKKYQFRLRHKSRLFTTFSNYSEQEVFGSKETRKWNRVIFFIHGFPDNNTTFDEAAPKVAAGFSRREKVLTLAPLMRGYEPSSQGSEYDYKVSNMASDIRAWIESLDVGDIPVHVVGHDWGAVITYKFASMYPDLVKSVACLAIPNFGDIKIWEMLLYVPQQLYYSSYMFTMQYAMIYRRKFGDFDTGYLENLIKYWSPNWNVPKLVFDSIKKTLSTHGSLDGSTAYYRNLARLMNFSERRFKVDYNKVPTLILYGETDQCMCKKLYDLGQTKIKDEPNAKIQMFSTIGHFLQREDPDKVAEAIADWFQKHP